ncbi:hypothetical protein BG003_005462 [Podila horticola]|nr:hypothetical protein BG003_005462 [Podila horticola]
MAHTCIYTTLWSQIVQDTKDLATQLMGRVKSCGQQANDCMVPQLRQPNPKSQSVPPSLNSNNVYQHRTPNTLTRFSTLYATFPRHSRLNTKHSNHTLKNRSSRRFSSLWEVQLELGEIPGMLSPNILEPYQPMSQILPLSLHDNTNSTQLFIERTIANDNSNESYSSFSSYVFSDIDVREDEGEEESRVEEDQEEEKRVEGEEEMEGEEEEEQQQQEEGDGDEPFGDFYFPDGVYSYAPLHPSDSASSLLLPGPLPWATIVGTPEEMEDETTAHPSPSSSTFPTSSSSLSSSLSAEIILVKYETRETILEDEEGEDEMDTDGLEPHPVTAPAGIATASALGIHPLDGPYAIHSVPATEEQVHQNDVKDQEQTQVVSFSSASTPSSSSSSSKSTRPAPTLLFSSVHSEMRQDRKDSGVFIMHDDGFIKMETENGPLLPVRPASVMANHDAMSVFYSSPERSESESVMDQGDAASSASSRLHMYSSLVMSSSLISLSA